MRTGNKMKTSSWIIIVEVASSCYVCLYGLYRCKVHPALLAVCTHCPQGIFRRPAKCVARVTSDLKLCAFL